MPGRIAAVRLQVNDKRRNTKAAVFIERFEEIPEELEPFITMDDPTRVLPEGTDLAEVLGYDDSTVAAVLTWVDDDEGRARFALANETAGTNPRSSLVRALTGIIEAGSVTAGHAEGDEEGEG